MAGVGAAKFSALLVVESPGPVLVKSVAVLQLRDRAVLCFVFEVGPTVYAWHLALRVASRALVPNSPIVPADPHCTFAILQ